MSQTDPRIAAVLVENAALREQLAEARRRLDVIGEAAKTIEAEGRREGLEEAAALAQGISHVKGTPRDVARELRGLVLCVAESHASHTKENPHG